MYIMNALLTNLSILAVFPAFSLIAKNVSVLSCTWWQNGGAKAAWRTANRSASATHTSDKYIYIYIYLKK